ncbi:MAG: MFS transporter, partial [Candidatus Ranarchaeia archaeon]
MTVQGQRRSKTSYADLLQKPIVPISILLGLMSILGSSLIPPVIPYMIAPLGATQETIGLVLSAYTLPSVFLSPPIGLVIDKYGRKPFLAFALLIYSITGILSGFAA